MFRDFQSRFSWTYENEYKSNNRNTKKRLVYLEHTFVYSPLKNKCKKKKRITKILVQTVFLSPLVTS